MLLKLWNLLTDFTVIKIIGCKYTYTQVNTVGKERSIVQECAVDILMQSSRVVKVCCDVIHNGLHQSTPINVLYFTVAGYTT